MSQIPLKLDDRVLVRPFRVNDREGVHKVYLKAMHNGASSPTNQAIKAKLTKPWSLYFYAQTITGALCVIYSPVGSLQIIGGLLVVSGIGAVYGWCRNTRERAHAYTTAAITSDLADVLKSYGAPGSGFWVAEVVAGSENGKIVGCVGLDNSSGPDKDTAELRRMAVIPSHQNQGIGTKLLRALIAHATEHHLTTITLSTTEYQAPAIKLYEGVGFKEVNRVRITAKFLFMLSSATVHVLKLSL